MAIIVTSIGDNNTNGVTFMLVPIDDELLRITSHYWLLALFKLRSKLASHMAALVYAMT